MCVPYSHMYPLCCCPQLPYTEAVVKEALRLLAPGAIATRITQQEGLSLTPEVWCPTQT
jgi:hypothetical protein